MVDVVNVQGLKELQEAMKQLPDRIARNVLRGSVAAGASVIRKEAQAKAPVYTGSVAEGHPPPGTLKRSIVQKQIPERSSFTKQTFFVTVRKGKKYRKQGKKGNLSQDAYYASWVEFGHHARGSGKTQGKWVAPQPYMRPAFEGKKNAAVTAIAEYIEKRLPVEVAKLPGVKP